MWTSLRGRFVVLMLLTMGGATAVSILIIDEIERSEALRAIEREEASVADSVQQVVASSLEREAINRRRLQQLTEELARSSTIQWVEVFDDRARVIAHSDHTRLGHQPLELHRDFVERILAGSKPISEEDAEHQRFNLFVPLTQDDSVRPIGVIEVVLSWEPGQPAPVELGRAAAAAAQSVLAQSMINANLERARLQQLVESLAKKDSLKRVEIFDRNTTVIAHSKPDRIGQTVLPQHSPVVRSIIQNGRPDRLASDDGKEIALFLPIASQGDSPIVTRVVAVAIDPAPILARLARSRTRYLWSFAIVAFIAGVALWASSDRLVFQPLERVTRAAREVAEGRVGTTVSCGTSGQISELVDAFNHMSRSLESTMVSRDELAASEERLQLALEATHTSCWDVELDRDSVVSTRTMEPLLGYDPSEVEPSREWWRSLVHPDDVTIKEQALQDYLNGSAPIYECEYRVRSASGEWRWILDRGHAVTHDEHGRPGRMVGTDTDITRLKHDEQLLHGQNRILEAIATGKRLSDVLSLVIELVETADPDAIATVLLLNPQTQSLHGVGRNRLPAFFNRAIDGLKIGPDTGACGTAAFRGERVVAADIMSHKYFKGFHELAAAAGVQSCWSEPVIGRDGQVLGTFAIYHDEPREPAEEALAIMESAARLSAIAIQRDQITRDLRIRDRALASTSNGVVIVDAQQPDQPVIYCNSAFERITGYSSSDVIGRNCRFLQAGKSDQSGLEEVRQAIREQRDCRVIIKNVRENGEPFWNELTISPVFDDAGQATHFVGIQDDVTQRLEAEKELITSELRFRTLVEFAPEAVSVLDVEAMQFVDSNQNAAELFGVDRETLLTMGPKELSPEFQPDGQPSLEMAAEFIARTLAGEAPVFEWTHIRSDGTLIPTEVRLVRLPSDEGQLIRGSATDISERKRIENTLRQAEARFRDLYDQAPDMYFSADVGSLCIVDCNQTTLDKLGYSRDQIIGRPVTELYASNCADQVAKNIAEFRRSGRVDGVELQVLHADGSVIDVSLSASAIRDGDGHVVESRAIWRDITKRKQAERERTEALTRFESIASNIPDCFWRTRVNPDGSYQVEYVSPAWEKIWGYSVDEILSNADLWLDVVLDEDRSVAQQAFEAVLKTGERQTASYRIRTRDGQVRWLEDRMSAALDESGRVILLEGVARDVTEQRNAEELARQQMEQLAHVGRLTTVGELATGIAHELNQPLTTIVNTAFICEQNLTQEKEFSSDKIRKAVTTISDQAFRASEIIRRLRSLVKRTPLAVSDFDVNRAINEVVSLIRPIARQNVISVQLSLNDSLPCIRADEIQVQQVILNLLKNACDALLQAQTVERQIVVESHLTDTNDVMISVSDNGPGLPGDAASQAFEAFFSTKDDGMGMGLAISRSIIETHRGRLWAENNSQGGATFWLTLPVTMERRRRA